MIKELLMLKPLFVFALESEATNLFNDMETLFVGVGKVNAAYHLTKQIENNRPGIIINLGSAGSNLFQKGTVVCCSQFVQRDMDASMLGCRLYETPFSGIDPILDYGIDIECLPKAICGTGDTFEMNHTTTIYNVVDMESYALAFIAKQEKIPFLCLKYISDGADDNAAEEWPITVKKAARALRSTIDGILNNP